MNPNNYSTGTARLFARWMTAAIVAMVFFSANVVNAQVSVSATAGTTGPTSYTTVSAAFAAINAGTHQGAITIRIVGNTTEPGSVTALLKSASPSNYTSVRIEPFGGDYTIGGTITANRAIIELNGADNVTIDGDDPTWPGARNLTIGFSTTAATIATCIRVSSNSTTGTDGATNNTVKNCIITGNRVSAGTTATYGISMCNYSTTSSTTGGYSSINNRFENNLITRCYHGIWAVGASATYPNTGLRIINNKLGDGTVAGNIGLRGIIMSYSATTEAQSAVVSGNEVVGVGDPGTTGYSASIAGMEIGTVNFGAKIFNNYVHDVKQPTTGGYGAYGVLFSGATSCDSMRFYNNIVTRITASNYTATALSSFTNYGIKMSAGPTFGDFSNNTIVLNTANPTGTLANPLSYALSCDVNGVRLTNFRNNIIVNSIASTNAIGMYVNSSAIYTASNYSGGQIWDRNCYWVPTGILGYSALSTPQTTFSAWKTATGKDASSFNVSPNFVSATDLHLNGSVASLLESGGMTTSYNTDFDGQTRPGPAGSTNGGATGFDVGADEYDGIPIIPVSISSASATGNSCTAVSHTVTATVVPGTNAVTSVTLTYSYNGTAQTPITMTNTSGNTWEGVIPAATPTNATVAWTVTAVDAVSAPTSSGSYQDEATYGVGSTAVATPASVCTGSNTSLSVSYYNPIAAPTTYTIQAVTNPTTDEDLGNVTITDAATSTVLLNNTSTYNSLVGTLGTATGTAGSYASYLSFGSISLTAGSTYNFSLSSLQGASAFGNSMAIYIDFNRDGDYADAGENVYVAAATTSGAHTETGSFTIPATANNGLTRMRVICNEGLVTSPTMAISYGEREEYLVNLITSNNGGGGNIPSFTYSWSDGSTTLGTTNPLSVTVAAATTYTVTSTTTAGCTIAASVAVTAIPLPAAPTATNSTQCGARIPDCSVSSNTGLSSPTFRWYADATGGSALLDGPSATYGFVVSTTDTLWVSEFDGSCESARTPVIVTLLPPPGVSMSPGVTICSGKSTSISVSSINDPNYQYTWDGGAGTGATVTVSPLSTTVYQVTALDTTTGANAGCITTGTVTVTVIQSPVPVTITATPSTICSGTSSTLATSGGTITTSGQPNIGAQSLVNATTGYPSPYTNYYGGTKHQMLYLASELQAAGIPAGASITVVAPIVYSTGSTFSGVLNSFQIDMKLTTVTALTGTFETGLTNVRPAANLTVPAAASTTGANAYYHLLSINPFVWDGTSNLLIQTSYSNANSGTTTDYVQMIMAAQSVALCSYYRVDGATAASVLAAPTASFTSLNRPSLRLYWQQVFTPTWSWSPNSSDVTANVTVSPATTTNFTATATQSNGCTSTGSVTLTVNPSPVATCSKTNVTCNGAADGTATVVGNGGTGSYTYSWSNGATTASISGLAPGTYTATVTDSLNCTASCSVTITQPTALTASASGSSTVCGLASTTSVTVSASGGTAPYTGTGSFTQGVGATSYTVSDANGCTASATTTITSPSYTIIASTGGAGAGSITPSGSSTVDCGDGLSYTIAPASSCDTITDVLVDGVSVGAVSSYTFTNVTANRTISAVFGKYQYAVTATAGANGTVSGPATVVCGNNATYTFTPDACYQVADVLVDGNSVGAVTSYTLNNVTAPVTVSVSFSLISYSITATASTGGSITPAGVTSVNCGGSQTYTMSAGTGFVLDSVIVNGVNQGAITSYTFTNLQGNATIALYASSCSNPATVTMPSTAAICSGVNYALNGSFGGGATSATWSSSGTGTFDDVAVGVGTTYTPSAADIAAGSVILTITTNDPDGSGACQISTASTVLTINTTPTVSITGTAAFCTGSSTTLTASATNANSYSWSSGQTTASISVNVAGSYSVTVTGAGSCTAAASVTVVENSLPAAPTVSASGNTTFCTGGSVTLTSSYTGGNTWSNGATTDAITVSAAGSYTVTYTDGNGCTASSSATAVTVNTSSASISGTLGICAGGSTTLTASATPAAVSYLWSDGSTNSTLSVNLSGTYSVTTTDANGCTAVASATVVDAASFTVAVTSNCTNWVVGNTANLTATPSVAGTYTYLWSPGGNTGASRNASNAGTYTVTVTDQFGCSATGSITVGGAPLSGSYTIGGAGCGNFTTLASAVSHLSTYGVSGNVTINLPAGFTETAPVGGYQLNMCGLAAGLRSGPSQTITFQKSGSGANPILTAYVGTSTTIDGIFVITGTDNVTINGINLAESAGNTTATTRMEWGYAVLKCSGDDGSNDVVITNCNIALASAFTAGNGIYVANHNNLSTTGFTNSTYATTAQAARNKVSITNNTLNNCYTGIRLGANPNVVAATGECLNDTLNNISNNTITNFGGAATSAYGIYYGNNRGITIRSNTISSSTTATSTTSGGIYALSGTWATICGNTIQNIVTSSTFYGIYHALAGGDATNPNIVRIDSNIIQANTPTAGSFYGIYGSSTGGTSAQVSTSYNQFRNNTFASTSTATMYGMYQFNSGTNMVFNCKYNLVYNNTLQNTNTFYGIYGYATSGTYNCQYNTIRNNILSPSSGTTYILYASSSNETHMDYNNVTNNRRNVLATATSVGTTYGIYALSGSTLVGSINNNVIDTLYNTGVPGTLTSLTYGFYYSASMASGSTISNNIIRNITVQGVSTGNQTIYASYFAPSAAGNIIKGNRIARIGTTTSTTGISTDAQLGGSMNGFVVGAQLAGSTTAGNTKFFEGNTFNTLVAGGSNGISRGIWATTGQDWNIYNNAISRISAPFANPATAPTASSSTTVTTGTAVHGIDIANATAGYNFYLYNNTVYLTGNGGGANFATTGIHANITPNVTLVNNLVINLTNSGTSQAAVAYRRSGATLTTYQAASDNNLFYAGTPGTTKLIYGEGIGATTNAKQTLADFKTFVSPRDASSRTENTTFTAPTTDSLLHVSTSVATFVESGGKPYPATALTTDIDGQTRSTTAPDIGADENTFIGLLPQIASVTASPATGQCTAVNHTVTVVVGSNVTVTAVTLNYSLNGTAQTPISLSNGGSGTSWTGVIPASGSSVVTFSATATDGTNSVSANGTSYQDNYLNGLTLVPAVSPTTICAGSSLNLNAYIGSTAAAPTTYGAANATSTADEEILGVTFKTLNQTSACGALAPGAGSIAYQYSNYTGVPAPLVLTNEVVSFSVTVGTCGGNYTNRSVIYIDWNRDGDFVDAGEQFAEPAAVSGPHVWSGTITVPSTVTAGYTRMRVITNETTTITAPTGTFSWGEVEDYTIQLGSNAGFTYSWSDGTSVIATANGSYTPAAAGTYSYTVTGTDANGCTIVSAPATVTVNPSPVAPTAVGSTQCGNAIPTCSVTGSGSPSAKFRWYLAATGGTALAGENGSTLVSYAINTTTDFYVSEYDTITGCEGPRALVAVTVTQPVPVTATADFTTVCPLGTVTLTAALSTPAGYTYTWYKKLGTGAYSAIGTGSPITDNPFQPGTYTYSVQANDPVLGCATSSTVNVTVTTPPSITSVSAAPTTLCLGDSTTLTGVTTVITSGPQTGPTGYPASNATSTADEEILSVTFKTLTQASTCGALAPGAGSIAYQYSNYTGVAAPTVSINEVVSFSVQIGTCGGNYTNRSVIYIDWNRDGDFLDANETAATEPAGVSGPHIWSGTLTVPASALAGVTRMRVITNETSAVTASNVTYTWGETEDYHINVLSYGVGAGTYTWSWTDGSSTVASTNVATVTPASAGSYSYTVIATDPATGCTNSGTAGVTVLPLPSAPSATNSSQCGTQFPTASVASTSGDASPVFNWFDVATGGTALQSGASTTYGTLVSSTTTFYVSESSAGCTSARTPVTVTVNSPDSIAVTSTAAAICLGASIDLAVFNTVASPQNSYSFSWINAIDESGFPIDTLTGANQQGITPSAVGTYTYTAIASDPTSVLGNCSAVAYQTVTVNPNPVIDSINALPAGSVCAGTSISLNAYSVGSGPQTSPTGYCAGSPSTVTFADEQIFGVSFASMSNLSQGETCGSNYTNYTASIPAPTVVAGASYPFTVVTDECDGATYYSSGLSIFIDWNRDGDFLDANETAYTTTVTTVSPNTRTGSITVPATATAGVTRMRVVVQESVVSPTSCPSFSYGEMEDYNINVLALSNGGNTWSWQPGGMTGNQATATPTATTTYVATATNAYGCTTTASVNKDVIALPSAPTAVDNTICGYNLANVSVTSTTGASTPVFAWYLQEAGGSAIPSQTGSSLSNYYLSAEDTFWVSESDGTCSSARTMVIQHVTQPDSVVASSSVASICLPGASFNLSATQTGSTNSYSYAWTAVPPVGSGLSGVQLGPLQTLFQNDFTNTALPSNVTLVGSANISGGVLQVTPNTLSQSGGVKITAGGNAADTLSVGFDLIVPQNGADGVSYSYSDDGVETVQASMNSENGTGSKLKLAFVSYTNGTSTNGIYLMYNCTVNEQTPTTTGVLAYSADVSWRASATPKRVTYTVGSSGLFNLALNGTPIFTNVQLPAAYVAANKSNWYHIFKARTGGVSEEHSIDNMIVQAAQIQSVPTPGQNITVTPTLPGTYAYYVTATDGACSTQSYVSVLVNPAATPVSVGNDVSVCTGSSVQLQVSGGGGGTSTTAEPTGYCAITGAGQVGPINVSIGSLNYSSVSLTASPYYEFVPASVATTTLVPGTTYTLSITCAASATYPTGAIVSAWFDWNRNGVFETTEWYQPYTTGLTGTIQVTVPMTAQMGLTRLRVRSRGAGNTNGAGDGCTSFGSGEGEDLQISIGDPSQYSWTSIPSGFTGAGFTPTFGPITAATQFVAQFNNGQCSSYDTVLVTPVDTPAAPVVVSNRDSLCITGNATYTASNVTQGTTLMWQYYNLFTQTWTNTDSTRNQFITPYITPVLGDSILYYRLAAYCGTNASYSNVDTLQIVKPMITSVINDTVCGIGSLDLGVNGNGTMNWYQTSSSTAVVNTGYSYTVNTLTNVVYWVRASIGSCLDPAGRQPVFGIVNPAPAITVTPNQTICDGETRTLTVSSLADTNGYYTYTWLPDTVINDSITVQPRSTTTYTVVAQSASGCGNYGISTITVNSLPALQSVNASSSTICQGSSTTLSVTMGNSSGPQALPTGYCSGGGSTTTADEQIFSVSFGSMTNAQTENCSNNNTDYTSSIPPITVATGTSVPWSVTVDECDGATYFASGLSIFIDYNRDGDWDDAGEQAYTSGNTITAPVTRSGSITIPLTASLGWTRMRIAAMESVTSPTACGAFSYGEVEDYVVNITGNAGTIVWQPGALTGQSVSVSPTATTSYTVTVTSPNGCSVTGTTTVNVLPFNSPVAVTAGGPTTVCSPSTVSLSTGSYDNYLWSTGETTQSISASASGNYSVTVSNSNGCSGSASLAVTVNPSPTPVISSNPFSICVGIDTATLSVAGSYTSYLWSTGETTSTIRTSTAGNFDVTVTNSSGCTGTGSFLLVGNAAPAQPMVIIPSTDTLYYCWDGVTPGSVFVMADVQSEPITIWNDPLSTSTDYAILGIGNGPTDYGFGSHLVTITSIGAGGCTAVDSFRLIVALNPAPTVTGDLTLCSNVTGATTTLDAGAGYSAYSWSSGETTQTITATAGTYTVTVTGVGGCTGSATVTVSTVDPVVVNSTETACDSYTWSVDNTTYTASGIYTASLGTAANGCDSSAVLDLTINNSVAYTDVQVACNSYIWIDAVEYTASGIYGPLSFTTAAGCDSVVTLDLTINTNCSGGVTLNLTAFLEGYYAGSGAMQSVLANQAVANATGFEADTVWIELRDSLDPTIVVDAQPLLLMTDGTGSATFPAAVEGTSYWICLKHRMSIQTWSATEVLMTASTDYDFTTSDAQAFGNNMKEVEPGVWAIFSGDLNQDEFIDPFDFGLYLDDSINFAYGYYASDMNGDGFTDPFDFGIYLNNSINFVMSMHP